VSAFAGLRSEAFSNEGSVGGTVRSVTGAKVEWRGHTRVSL
jgi:hypothetical protein